MTGKGGNVNDKYVIGHDAGTGGDKAILTTTAGDLVATGFEPYDISHPGHGCAEQNPVDWWDGVAATTRRLVSKTGIDSKAVSYTHLRAHETRHDLVCRLLLEKK